jgi:vitamin B12 transporter
MMSLRRIMKLAKGKNVLVWVFALAGWTAVAAGGQVESDGDSIVDLPRVTVVASRIPLQLGMVGASVTTLEMGDLARFEFEVASDVIRHVEGVYLRNNGNPGSASGISMRGIPLAPVVLIDGIEVNDPGSGFVFNFGNLPMASIASIEVLRGAQSALYGANALTGVISIRTRQGVSTEPAAVVGVSYGSRDSMRTYATVSQALERFDYFVSASFDETDGYSVQDPSWGPEWADDDLYRNTYVMGKFGYKVTDKVDVMFFTSYLDSKSEYDPGEPSPWSTPVFDNYVETEQVLAKGQVQARLAEGWKATLGLSHQNFETYAVDGWGVRDNKATLTKVDLLQEIQVTEGLQTLVGLETKRAEDRIGDYSMRTSALFVENVARLAEGLHVTAALRYDDNNTFGSETTWRVSASWEIPNSRTRLKASYGISYDAPEISELFGTWGNPDLTPESGNSVDVGVEQQVGETVKLGLTWFQIRMDDHIEYLRSTYSYANVDWESQGVEASVLWDVSKQLDARIAYTWADAKRLGVDDALLFHSPEHTVSVMLDLRSFEERLKTSLTAQYVSKRETWSGSVGGFTVVDLTSRYQVTDGLELWVRVENALDEDYQEILGYRAPRRGYFGGIKFEF